MTNASTRKAPLFFVDRADGLGERLRAITNAIICSKHFSGKYYFTWQLRQGPQVEYNSIDLPENIFNSDFLREHMILPSSYPADSDIIELIDYDPASFGTVSAKYIRVQQTPVYRTFPFLRQHILNDGFSAAFSDIIFSKAVIERLNRICYDGLDGNTVAIHLRAGDIIYGIYSDSARFCNKAIPYQIAEKTIQELSLSGKKIIILGQDTRLIDYFAEKYGCSTSLSLYDPTDFCSVSSALADMFIMSKCTSIFAGSSGFSMLASSIANEIHQNFIRISPETIDSLFSVITAEPDSELVSIQQRLFSLRWIVGMAASIIDTSSLLQICTTASTISPRDLFFLLVTTFCYLDMGDESSASTLKANIISQFPTSSVFRLLNANQYGKRESANHILPRLREFILS